MVVASSAGEVELRQWLDGQRSWVAMRGIQREREMGVAWDREERGRRDRDRAEGSAALRRRVRLHYGIDRRRRQRKRVEGERRDAR